MLSRTLVAPIETPESRVANRFEPLPLSLLNDFFYCPRRAALKVVEGWRAANEHTNRGDIVHDHTDLAGYEVVKGVTLLRALPVWSDRLGLNTFAATDRNNGTPALERAGQPPRPNAQAIRDTLARSTNKA